MSKRPQSIILATLCVPLFYYAGSVAARAEGGSIIGWGAQVISVDLGGAFVSVDAGGWHSLGLRNDGSIIAWGDNFYGESDVPNPNSGFVAIAAGSQHSLGLKADGSIVAWG